jgi:L-iditol 2-dehydrogenase
MPLVARLHGIEDLRVTDEPRQTSTADGWSRIAITSVGICGSDLHWFSEGTTGDVKLDRPVVPGHEFAGVAMDGPYAGRRVAVDPAIPCFQCEYCRQGNENLCPTVQFAGHATVDGALQEEIVWPDRLLHPLPDAISDDAGALLEPLGVAIHTVDLAHVRSGDDVLVLGAGPIGVLAEHVALRAGARRVLVAEPLAHRRETAMGFGAHGAWHPDLLVDAVHETTSGRGVDVVVEAAGTDAAIATGVACARPGARIALAGIPSTPSSSFPAAESRRKGLTFVMVRRMKNTYERAIQMATSGLDLDSLVSARLPLSRAPEAFEVASARRGDKTVIVVRSAERTSSPLPDAGGEPPPD